MPSGSSASPTLCVPDRRFSSELPEGGVGAAAEQVDCDPAVARDDRAVGAEALTERRELLRGRRRVELPCRAVALADTEVVDGPDVEPAQLEHQVHLRGPAADTADGDELGDQLVVAEPRRPIQLHGAVED